jgi:hypothetical protein
MLGEENGGRKSRRAKSLRFVITRVLIAVEAVQMIVIAVHPQRVTRGQRENWRD